jgi:hypothetical protein
MLEVLKTPKKRHTQLKLAATMLLPTMQICSPFRGPNISGTLAKGQTGL